MKAKTKLLAEGREIIFIDTTNMTEEQKAWVKKCRDIIQQREMCSRMSWSNKALMSFYINFVSFCLDFIPMVHNTTCYVNI
jgi:hypothetical protein